MASKETFGDWVIRYRWWVIIATLLVVAAAGSGGRFLGFSSDYRVFFSEENPQLKAFEALQNTYTKNDNAMIGLAPKDGNIFTRETLAVVEEVTRAAWQVPYSIRVDSVTNFQYTSADGDDLLVRDLVEDARDLSDADLKRIREIALNEPLLVNRLVSSSGHVTGVDITLQLPGKSTHEVDEVVKVVRHIEADLHANHPEIDVYLTGVAFMNNSFVQAAQGDMKTLIPTMYLIVMAIMVWVLRSILATLTTVLVIVFSIFTAMGLAGWAGLEITTISANAPTIILTLAVADSIHLLVTMFYEMRHGKSKREAIIESLRVNQWPVFITSITTAIGFLSLNFSDSPPYQDLGNIVATGVMMAYVYSILFLPAMMAVLPVRVRPALRERRERIDRLADFVIRRRRPLFWGMLCIIVALMAQIPGIEIDEKFNEYFDTRYKFRTDNDFMVDHLVGFYTLQYSLGSGESGGISNPDYLAQVEDFAQWYRKQPGVTYVGTLTDTMKRLNKNLHGDDPAWYRLPQERDLAAQYLLLYELSLPFGLDLNNQINIDKSSTRVNAILQSVSTREVLAMEDRAQEWLKDNAPAVIPAPGSSPLIMFSHIAKRNLHSMITGNLLALTLISGIMILALRSFKFGVISLVPNLVPAFMAFGVWALVFHKIGMAISVVGPVALGIIVDDTVHFLTKYLRARRELGKHPEEAVRYSFHTVGTALWVTSLILVAGFLVLTYSGFTMNIHLGLLTAMAIVAALMADFLLLPPLVMKVEGVPLGNATAREGVRRVLEPVAGTDPKK